MAAMSPQQEHVGQGRSSSLTGEPRAPAAAPDSKKKMKSLAQRRQSAPSLVLSKALNKSRTITREGCFSPISPEACPLVQSFICPSRALILNGHVQLKTGLQTQERHLFLFTDLLVVAKSKSQSHFKLKSQARLCEMWTASCMEEVCEGSTNPEKSFVLGWPTTNCVVNFSSPEQKEKWLSSLQSRIKEEKEKDYPKSIPLKIIAKDVGICAYSKTLTVTNADTANDVILMALQQLGINGSEKDYQLWVNSGKEDAPYPLIGHEYPFGIKMSHIRDAMSQTQGSKDCASPLDLQGSLLMEQLPRDLQCQFILKPSRLALCQQLNELSQKPFKRKRSIINWAFWRGPGTQMDNTPVSPTSLIPGKLFGLSLSAICENDNLPKPVLDMLTLLYQEGPFTRGIFRRSANAKSCRDLKEKLNSGAEVHLACESIFVTASVFKDFLRSIPGSIFLSQLCDKWISVMDQGNEEEKIKGVQRLMEQLPRANVVLLRYLFGVLYNIEKQSEDNQMTAFNLAVCIAPSLLWPPTPSSPETESEFTKKISILVQFLIENCCRIFGEEVTSLFGDMLIRCDNREDGSDLSSFHLNDSSYDSLENELNDDADSSFSDLIKKRGQDNRSRDSVLTLSDCDLDQPEIEEIQIKLPPKSKPVRISAGLHHKSSSKDHSENEPLCSDTLGYSSAAPDALKNSRRHRRCSEPSIGLPTSKLTHLSECQDNTVRKASCDAVLSHVDEDYLKQLRSLQMEGQKLINQSLVMGIDVGRSSTRNQTGEKKDLANHLLPPTPLRLNICSRTSCSSLSSPGTSPSGSSMSSLDSAFSQFSDYSVFTPTETSSPLDCGFQFQKKPGDLSPECNPFCGIHQGAGVSSFSNQASNSSSVCVKKESLEWPPQKSPVTLHPSTWLKNGASTVKNWTLRKKDKASKQEEKKKTIIKITLEPHVDPSDPLEDNLCQEQWQVLKAHVSMEKNTATETVQDDNPSSTPGSGQPSSAPFCPTEVKDKKLKALELLAEQSKEEEEAEKENSQLLSHKRQPSNPVIKCPNPSAEDAPELGAGHELFIKDSLSKTAMSMEVDGQQINSESNKALLSTESKSIEDESERGFCLSLKATRAVDGCLFKPDVDKSHQKVEAGTDTMIQINKERLKKHCSDPKFEEIDQRIFAEESYV
ncbi:rho GTPase-activating protein 20 isoform X1 [Alligator mississippiensis]|uniref:rho GTPase-activating protein 20 isoform X1 n=1 Tax=Alligator mississippiensis TaxID=8496 RepID=UPI0003D0C204|nr:rho GTPase-activating protein 20 isoform X1 [Alligator mississippiensis]